MRRGDRSYSSVAEVRNNEQPREQYLVVWEFGYLLKEEHGRDSAPTKIL